MLSGKDKQFISEIIKTASVSEIKEFARKCAEILSKESKTPPTKEKSFLSEAFARLDESIKRIIEDRMRAASGDKDAISKLSGGGPINPNSLFINEEERQEFIKKFGPNSGHRKGVIVEPEYQNPAAAHFVTTDDFIESGRYRVTRSECVQPEENENRFILTVEIVESAGGNRD